MFLLIFMQVSTSVIINRKKNSIKIYFSQIGGDGKIFVGRSWNQTNIYDQISIAICLMGDFSRSHPNEHYFNAIFRLIDYGISLEYIHKDYRIIAHRQIRDTRSPGEYVYRNMSGWNHYDSCDNFKDNINFCGKDLGYTLDDWKSPKNI